MYKVWSTLRPAIWTTTSGQRRLAGGTIQKVMYQGKVVPNDVSLPPQVELAQVEWVQPPKPAPVLREVQQVRGSSGKVYLLERQPNGKWSCTCPGYQFRRFCKHTGAK